MNVLLEKLFENRHYSGNFFNEIVQCNHKIPANIDILCEKLHKYRLSGEQVVVLTDFDFDGICSGVIGFGGLAELGFNVAIYMPSTTDGYGFSSDTIDDLLSQFPDCKAILTGDVGITCYGGIAHARDLGIDMFVTDHHKGFGDAGATVAVDPQRPEDTEAYPFSCGAAVMYYTLHYYAEHFADMPFYMMQQIDRLRVFAGFGTVSDSMPVYYENRELINDAISICKFLYADGNPEFVRMITGCDVYRRIFYGLYVMLDCFSDCKKLKDAFKFDESFIGYYIAPAFNSVKRLGEDISIVYTVFFGGPANAKPAMKQVMKLNEIRKEMVKEKMLDLYSVQQPWAPYIYITDALPGICGLLAQNVMSVTGEPSLVLYGCEDGSYQGSGRSPMWYPFLDIAGHDPEERWYPAGHNPAFGIGVDDEACMDALFDFLKDTVVKNKPSEDELRFVPDFVLSTVGDGDCGLDIDVLHGFLHELEMCKPFGNGFPEHKFLLRFRSDECSWRLMGDDKDHVKVVLPGGVTLVCFNQGTLFPGKIYESDLPEIVEVVGSLSYNDFNNVSTIQIIGFFRDPDSLAQEGEFAYVS